MGSASILYANEAGKRIKENQTSFILCGPPIQIFARGVNRKLLILINLKAASCLYKGWPKTKNKRNILMSIFSALH